jgi:RimJ/RimL family protein N-acetyltransferase
VAGNVVCFENAGRREVGYWVGREFWGRGVATAALAQFLSQLPARPLYAHAARHNGPSIRVLEKCGFTAFGEDTNQLGDAGEAVEELVYILGESEPASGGELQGAPRTGAGASHGSGLSG